MSRPQIRLLRSLEEFRACEHIQKAVWGNVGVGSEVLAVTQKYGGVVLGTVVGGKVVGCLYAFLACRHKAVIHWSHIMAVERGYRDQGLGFLMKLAHRRLALAQGIKSICWTYDPLQRRNATLNLHRLGAQVEEYLVDCYGQFASRIERCLPSDRFLVNWRIATSGVARRLQEGPPVRQRFPWPWVNKTRPDSHGFPVNKEIRLDRREQRLLVEIPSQSEQIRAQALPLARRWRFETRKIFRHYLEAGYRVETFLPPGPATEQRGYYVLRAGALEPVSDCE